MVFPKDKKRKVHTADERRLIPEVLSNLSKVAPKNLSTEQLARLAAKGVANEIKRVSKEGNS